MYKKVCENKLKDGRKKICSKSKWTYIKQAPCMNSRVESK